MRIAGIVLSICLWTGIVCAQEEALGLTKLSDHVYAYVGITSACPANSYGSNSGVIIGEKGVMVVDTRTSAKEAERLIADIRKVTDKPILYVVNTHYHLDHAGGNSTFVAEGAVVIAQEKSLLHQDAIMNDIAHPENFGLTASDIEGTVPSPPTDVFTDTKEINLGGVLVRLNYWGESHTNDSITVFVEPDSVLFLGDMLFSHYHPFLGEGNIEAWKEVLLSLEKMSFQVLVPGHGPLSTVKDLQDLSVYLSEFDKTVRTLCVGKTEADIPEIAQTLLTSLPEQGRTELPGLIEMNIRVKYLTELKPSTERTSQ